MAKTVTYFHTANYEVSCHGPEIELRNRNTGEVQRFQGVDARGFEAIVYAVPCSKLDQVLASYEARP